MRSCNPTKGFIAAILTFVIFSTVKAAEHDPDRIRLDETVISGNQELPKVLYILPWQSPEGRPELSMDTGLKDENVLRRIYPPAHRRELRYWNGLKTLEASEGNRSMD